MIKSRQIIRFKISTYISTTRFTNLYLMKKNQSVWEKKSFPFI